MGEDVRYPAALYRPWSDSVFSWCRHLAWRENAGKCTISLPRQLSFCSFRLPQCPGNSLDELPTEGWVDAQHCGIWAAHGTSEASQGRFRPRDVPHGWHRQVASSNRRPIWQLFV